MKADRVHKRFVARYVVFASLILTLGVFSALMVNYALVVQRATVQAQSVLLDSAKQQSALLLAKIVGKHEVLGSFAQSLATQKTFDEDNLVVRMAAVVESTKFDRLCLVNPDGKGLSDTRQPVDVSDRWYFEESLAGRNAIQFIVTHSSSQRRFALSVPIKRGDTVCGVVVGTYDEEALKGFLVSETSRTGYSFVCKSDGTILIGSDNKGFLIHEEDIANFISLLTRARHDDGDTSSQVLQNMQSGQGGHVAYSVGDESRYAVYLPTQINDWFIVNVVPVEVINADVRASTQSSVALIAIVMFSSLLVMLLLIRHERQAQKGLIQSADRLRFLAERDNLTGLYNRVAFVEKARDRLSGAAPNDYAMVYFDVDRFKVINDLLGYDAGDRLLRFIAQRAKSCIGESGVCCRLSADCFVVCLPGGQAARQKLYRDFTNDVAAFDLPFAVSISFGVYVIDDLALPIDTMLDRASIAQKATKGRYGFSFAYYDDAMRNMLLAEQEIAGMMRTALEQEQFALYLQPQYNHATGVMVGAEVLVRWQHPDKGLLAPGLFIPVFERNGSVSELDEYVWAHTCRLLRRWLDEGKNPPPLSVNVSRADIYNPKICKIFSDLLAQYNLPTRLLRLEITESAYMQNPEQLICVVRQLRAQGMMVEMDDFGSGYSSLNTLKNVPVDMIKLDMQFLSDPSTNDRQSKILKSIIAMIHDLDLLVIAEGVETREQADLLLSFGCTLVQGYYYAKPMPPEAFEQKF
ncbi:MAG: EAL domain-containing protein [Clostridia bacterium]